MCVTCTGDKVTFFSSAYALISETILRTIILITIDSDITELLHKNMKKIINF